MFPNPKHLQALRPQLSGDPSVPKPVAGILGPPEFGVGPGICAMHGAAVPEAAVHEHGDPLFRKHEIRPAREPGARRQSVIPWARNNAMSPSLVVRLPLPRMAAMTRDHLAFVNTSGMAGPNRRLICCRSSTGSGEREILVGHYFNGRRFTCNSHRTGPSLPMETGNSEKPQTHGENAI